MNFYAEEKIRELEARRMNTRRVPDGRTVQRCSRRPLFGPLAARAGRSLRRLGEGLEAWSRPQGEPERTPFSYRRR
jgi:hypothetical protein